MIKSANTSTFELPESVALMNDYHLEKVKANSSMKSDIEAIIKDELITQSKPIGFSIKSQVGGASTLLNASKRTSFIKSITSTVISMKSIIWAAHEKCEIDYRRS